MAAVGEAPPGENLHEVAAPQDTAATNDASRLTLPIPNTVYQGARFAVGARYRATRRLQVAADLAYRWVMDVGQDTGQVKSNAFFPMARDPWGIDGDAYVSLGLGAMFDVRAGVDYRRYTYGTLRGTTVSGTIIDATGAADQYIAGFLGVAALLDRGRLV